MRQHHVCLPLFVCWIYHVHILFWESLDLEPPPFPHLLFLSNNNLSNFCLCFDKSLVRESVVSVSLSGFLQIGFHIPLAFSTGLQLVFQYPSMKGRHSLAICDVDSDRGLL